MEINFLLFIAITYTIGVVISKFFDIKYDHNTYIDMFTSFFLIYIWTYFLTQSWGSIYSIIFSIIFAITISFIFGIFQNKKINNKDIKSFDFTNSNVVFDEEEIKKAQQEVENFKNKWIGLTGTIINYDENSKCYLGTLDNGSGSIIIFSNDEEKMVQDDHFVLTEINGGKIFCTKKQ